MVVDLRRDHSFRVPRPDLSERIGTPNACGGCHSDRTAGWAAAAIAGWTGGVRPAAGSGAEAIQAGRLRQAGACAPLAALASDTSASPIVRATAVSLLGANTGKEQGPAIAAAARDPEPLIRLAAAEAIEACPEEEQIRVGGPLLSDPVRAVRLQAARSLAGVPAERMGGLGRASETALGEWVESELHNADTAGAHVNIGLMRLLRGKQDEAEAAYVRALELDPLFVPALVNLADLRRIQGREAEAERLLREACRIAPDSAPAAYGLGMSLMRSGRTADAIEALERAARRGADDPRFAYTWGAALAQAGNETRAAEVWEESLARHSGDPETLAALVQYDAAHGKRPKALARARVLASILPEDEGVRGLLRDLGKK